MMLWGSIPRGVTSDYMREALITVRERVRRPDCTDEGLLCQVFRGCQSRHRDWSMRPGKL
jgi:hypothetical protein